MNANKSEDKITKAIKQAYRWRVVDGKAKPPKTDFPDYVSKRIEWISYEVQNNDIQPNFNFICNLLLDTNPKHEAKMKQYFELGAIQPYLPMTDEYRDWIDDFFTSFFRQQAVIEAFIFFPRKAKEIASYEES